MHAPIVAMVNAFDNCAAGFCESVKPHPTKLRYRPLFLKLLFEQPFEKRVEAERP